MRVLLILTLVAAVIAPNVPTLAGLIYWWAYDAEMEQLEIQGIDILLNERHAGWRRSTITTEFGYVDLNDLPRIKVVSEVEHGPLRHGGQWLLARAQSRLYIDGRPLTPEHEPAPIKTRVTFGHHVHTFVDIPPRELTLENGAQVTFDGMVALYDNQPPDSAAPFFRYEMAGATVAMPDVRLLIGKIEGTFQTKQSPAGNVLADHVFVAENLEITTADDTRVFAMRSLEAVSESDSIDQQLVGSSALHLDQLSIGDATYGPFVMQATSGGWNDHAVFEAAQGWQRLQRKLRQMDPEEVAPTMRKFWKSDGWPILMGNPHLSVRPIALTTKQGDIELLLDLSVNGVQKRDLHKHAWLHKISARASLSAPTAALATIVYDQQLHHLKREGGRAGWHSEATLTQIKQAAERKSLQALETIRRSGFVSLSHDQTHFIADLAVVNGKVTLNGSEVNPTQLVPALMTSGDISRGTR